MTTHLLIAGHGRKSNGQFDPGATGYISKGEHRYVKEDLFPAMKKYVPAGHKVIFFDEYNVYDRGNIVSLAKHYNADEVTEFHFDATGSSDARGGHVIVYSGYDPDKTDIALRNAIKKVLGVRYSHRGYEGISGRNNLANVNRTAKAGITYRLLELGFGTNKKDAEIMTENVDEYAKELVKALTGSVANDKTSKQPASTTKKQPNPKIRTGGLNEANLAKVVAYLKNKNWYWTAEGKKGKNPTITTGGLSNSMQKEFGDWLDRNNMWWTIER